MACHGFHKPGMGRVVMDGGVLRSRILLRSIAVAGIAAVSLGAGGCSPPLRGEGGLAALRASGALRVIVRPGFFAGRTVTASGEKETVIVEHLARRLGVRLRWVQAARNDQVLEWLREGRGELAVGRFAPAALARLGFASSEAIDWVDDLAVATPGSPLTNLSDVARSEVDIERSSLRGRFDPEITAALPHRPAIMPVPEETTLEEVLARVAGGRYRLTFTDSGLLDAFPDRYGLRIVGTLGSRRPVVWAIRRQDDALKRAIDDFLFAENVLSPGRGVRMCRSLEQIRRAGVLRLETWNSPTTCRIASGGLAGFEYRLVRRFARALRVRLVLRMPPPGTDPLRWLEEGYADLAALHQPLPPGVEGRFPVTAPYGRVDLLAVSVRGGKYPGVLEDLASAHVAADPWTARLLGLMPFVRPPNIVPLRTGSDMLSSVLAVTRGDADVAVIDSDTALTELGDWPSLRRGSVVMPACGLRWVVNPAAPALRRAADRFLGEAARSGLVRQLWREEIASPVRRWNRTVRIPPGHLTPYDDLLKAAGHAFGIDWRLLASIMYEESRFDPEAIGPGGSAGLFQLMPATWADLGVHDPLDPREAIPAAARYFKILMNWFRDAPAASRVAMALAAYNVGPRHVADARRLAAQLHLDPNVWSGNVETALLLLDNPNVARRFPAGVCRCRRAVGYARRILRRYQAYREEFSIIGSSGL